MAVFDKAEAGKYFNPHDCRLGGVYCEVCEGTLVWAESKESDGLVLISSHCDKKYILKESLDYRLLIEDEKTN